MGFNDMNHVNDFRLFATKRMSYVAYVLQSIAGRLKLRDMKQWHKNVGVEIAAQTSVDSPNHTLLQLWRHLCCSVLS